MCIQYVRSGTVTLYIVRQVCTSRSYACCVHGRAARPGGARCMHSDALVSGNDVSPAGSCSSRTDLGARSYYPCRSSSLRACSYDRTYTCLRSRFDSGCNVACMAKGEPTMHASARFFLVNLSRTRVSSPSLFHSTGIVPCTCVICIHGISFV